MSLQWSREETSPDIAERADFSHVVDVGCCFFFFLWGVFFWFGFFVCLFSFNQHNFPGVCCFAFVQVLCCYKDRWSARRGSWGYVFWWQPSIQGLPSQLTLKHALVLAWSQMQSFVFVLALVCAVGPVEHAVLCWEGKLRMSFVVCICRSCLTLPVGLSYCCTWVLETTELMF